MRIYCFGIIFIFVTVIIFGDGVVKSLYACLLGSSVSHRRVAHGPVRFTSSSVLSNTFSPYSPKSLATRVNVAELLLGTTRSEHHPQINNKM